MEWKHVRHTSTKYTSDMVEETLVRKCNGGTQIDRQDWLPGDLKHGHIVWNGIFFWFASKDVMYEKKRKEKSCVELIV